MDNFYLEKILEKTLIRKNYNFQMAHILFSKEDGLSGGWSRGREEGPGREATQRPDFLGFRLFLGTLSPAQFPLLCPSPFASGQSCPSVVFCAKYHFCEVGRGLSSRSEPLLKSFETHVTKCSNMNLEQA